MRNQLRRIFLQILSGCYKEKICNTSLAQSATLRTSAIPTPLSRLDLYQGHKRRGGQDLGWLRFANPQTDFQLWVGDCYNPQYLHPVIKTDIKRASGLFSFSISFYFVQWQIHENVITEVRKPGSRLSHNGVLNKSFSDLVHQAPPGDCVILQCPVTPFII